MVITNIICSRLSFWESICVQDECVLAAKSFIRILKTFGRINVLVIQVVVVSLYLTHHILLCCRHLGASAGKRGRMFASGLSCERALQALRAALDKEQQQWKPIPSRPVSSSQVFSWGLTCFQDLNESYKELFKLESFWTLFKIHVEQLHQQPKWWRFQWQKPRKSAQNCSVTREMHLCKI